MMKEAVTEIKGNRKESVMDIGRRFPLTSHLMARAVSGDGDAVEELLMAMPDYITVGKVEKVLKAAVENDEDEVEEEPAEKPAKKKPAKKVDDEDEEDEEEEEEKPAPKKRGRKKTATKKAKKKPEPEDDDEEDEDDDWDI